MALQANIWRKSDSPPWAPEDFIDGNRRDVRLDEYRRNREAVLAANAQLSRIVEGAPPTDEIPEWARGPYKGVS